MIQDGGQLQQSIEQLDRMYRALAEVHARVRPHDPTRYSLMAEGPLDEIHRLQADIESYLGAELIGEVSVSS